MADEAERRNAAATRQAGRRPPSARTRLDLELVRRGLAASRDAARELIDARRVLVGGAIAEKAARQVSSADPVLVSGDPPRFVSRGGEKLDAALEHFGVDVRGREAIDVGSSTGGFTDCLLQRGAAHVTAIDVGSHQLHERLRADARVTSIERLHVRDAPERLGRAFDLLVADLSFISLRTVLPALRALCAPGATAVLLVKPQFEAGREAVSRGRGVVRDPALHRETLVAVADACASEGGVMMGAMRSPLLGAEGNTEFLVRVDWSAASSGAPDGDATPRAGIDVGAWFDTAHDSERACGIAAGMADGVADGTADDDRTDGQAHAWADAHARRIAAPQGRA